MVESKLFKRKRSGTGSTREKGAWETRREERGGSWSYESSILFKTALVKWFVVLLPPISRVLVFLQEMVNICEELFGRGTVDWR